MGEPLIDALVGDVGLVLDEFDEHIRARGGVARRWLMLALPAGKAVILKPTSAVRRAVFFAVAVLAYVLVLAQLVAESLVLSPADIQPAWPAHGTDGNIVPRQARTGSAELGRGRRRIQ